jgi:hypothetical protein
MMIVTMPHNGGLSAAVTGTGLPGVVERVNASIEVRDDSKDFRPSSAVSLSRLAARLPERA